MSYSKFTNKYNTESKCVDLLKKSRDRCGVFCNRCGHADHYWLPNRQRYRCKRCSRETTIRSGTALEYSKLPVRYWVYAIAMMAFQKKSVSAAQMQRELGHPYYRPIWVMMQKLKVMMADHVERSAMLDHLMAGNTEIPAVGMHNEEVPCSGLPASANASEEKAKMHQSEEGTLLHAMNVEMKGLNLRLPPDHVWAKLAKGCRLRLVSMKVEQSEVQCISYHHPVARKTTPESMDVLPKGMNIRIRSQDNRPRPWFGCDSDIGNLTYTKIMAVNARRSLDGIHHYVSRRYLRNYIGEFCFLTNRRYAGENKLEQMFDLFLSKPWNLPYIVAPFDQSVGLGTE